MPVISVIVPVYNAGDYLFPCLESIAAQSFRDIEVLLVENASTDRSRERCREFCARDSRFVLHATDENLGPARARGLGLAHACGQYISFVDCDDLLHPQMLEALHHCIESTGLPVSCCPYDAFAADAQPENAPVPEAIRRLTAPDHIRALLRDHAVDYSVCNKLYRAELLRPEQFDTSFFHNEDLLINWQVLRDQPGIACIDFFGYHYRQHAASASHRKLQASYITDQLTIARLIRREAQGTALEPAVENFYYDKLLYLYSMILRQSNADDFGELRRKLLQSIRQGLGWVLMHSELSSTMKLAAVASAWGGKLYQKACRRMLTDRQS